MSEKVDNVVLITYSTTGNTKFVEDSISNKLGNIFSVCSFDALSIIKDLPICKPRALKSTNILKDLQQALSVADVIGVGGFAFNLQTPPGLTDIFCDEYLPDETFKNMKYFFSYATAGQRIGTFHDVLATVLSEKNKSAVYAGNVTVLAPENVSVLLPNKPYRDMWSQEQIDKIEPFVASLIKIFQGEKREFVFKKEYFKSNWLMEKLTKYMASVTIDRTKCKKCGTCARNCPYGALTMDIEDGGFPQWNSKQCVGCHMCFNHCPVEAINFGKSENKSRHPSPFLDPETKAILSTDAKGTVKGTPLPSPSDLNKRMLQYFRPALIRLAVIIVLIIFVFILFRSL